MGTRNQREAAVLGHVPVGAGQAHAGVGVVGAAAPDLRAGEDPAVAVAHRLGAHPGEIGPGVGIGEELRDDEVARQHLRDHPAEELRRGVGQHRRGAHPERGSPGDAEVGQEEAGGLLQEGLLVLAGEAPAAVLDRPGDAGVAGLVQPALEGALAGQLLGRLLLEIPRLELLGLTGRTPLEVLLDPGPGGGAVLLDRHVGCRRSSGHPRRLEQLLPVPARRAEELGVGGQAPEEQVLVVLPRVPDAAEHLEAGVGQLEAVLGHEGLGGMGQLRAVGVVGAEGGGRRRHDAHRHLERQAGVGDEVLEALERADRAPEGDPVLGVGDGHVEVGPHGADRLGGDQHGGDLGLVGQRCLGRLPGGADEVVGSDGDIGERRRRPSGG